MVEEQVHEQVEGVEVEASCTMDEPEGCATEAPQVRVEEFVLSGQAIVDKIKSLLHEGNIRRMCLKNGQGETLLEIPLMVGMAGAVVGAMAWPLWVTIGAIAAVVADLRLVVERVE